MTNQQPITEVVLRCRDCRQQTVAVKAEQQCESFQCRLRRSAGYKPVRPWSGWEIAHITRAEQAA